MDPMITRDWQPDGDAGRQLEELVALTDRPGVLVVRFSGDCRGAPPSWSRLEPWTRSRAVTVAVVATPLGSPGLDVALAADLVLLRPAAMLRVPPGEAALSAGVLWALGRAGARALRIGLLEPHVLTADEAVDLGLAHQVVPDDEELPVGGGRSLAALVAARDLLRARSGSASGSLALELATFRLLFAIGHPEEGARAFLERRPPSFK
jgi:enoyl-CoA hydratase/carnithine racemase